MVHRLDNVGGFHIPLSVLKKYFTGVTAMIKINKDCPSLRRANKLSHILIDDMTSFTNYVETNNQ